MLNIRSWFTRFLVWIAGFGLKRMLRKVIEAECIRDIQKVVIKERKNYNRMRWFCWKNNKVVEENPINIDGYHVHEYRPQCCKAHDEVSNILILLHGGAFIIGGNGSHGALASELANALSCSVYLVNYPLFPESKLATIRSKCISLVTKIVDYTKCQRYSLFGDSAGGFLACHVVFEFIKAGQKKPEVLYLLSPLLQNQFDFNAAAYLAYTRTDQLLGPSYRYLIQNPVKRAIALNRLGAEKVSAVLSVSDAILMQFPRVHLTYSKDEVLFPEIKAFQNRLMGQGVPVVDSAVDNAFHAFAVYSYIGVSQQYFREISQYSESLRLQRLQKISS